MTSSDRGLGRIYGRLRSRHRHEACGRFGPIHMSPCCLSPRPAPRRTRTERRGGGEDSAIGETSVFPVLSSPPPSHPKNPRSTAFPRVRVPLPRRPAKCAANAPRLWISSRELPVSRHRVDVGDQDGLRGDAGKLHEVLDKYGVTNGFEVYQGTHTSRVADRFQNHVMQFFSRNLCFQPGCR